MGQPFYQKSLLMPSLKSPFKDVFPFFLLKRDLVGVFARAGLFSGGPFISSPLAFSKGNFVISISSLFCCRVRWLATNFLCFAKRKQLTQSYLNFFCISYREKFSNNQKSLVIFYCPRARILSQTLQANPEIFYPSVVMESPISYSRSPTRLRRTGTSFDVISATPEVYNKKKALDEFVDDFRNQVADSFRLGNLRRGYKRRILDSILKQVQGKVQERKQKLARRESLWDKEPSIVHLKNSVSLMAKYQADLNDQNEKIDHKVDWKADEISDKAGEVRNKKAELHSLAQQNLKLQSLVSALQKKIAELNGITKLPTVRVHLSTKPEVPRFNHSPVISSSQSVIAPTRRFRVKLPSLNLSPPMKLARKQDRGGATSLNRSIGYSPYILSESRVSQSISPANFSIISRGADYLKCNSPKILEQVSPGNSPRSIQSSLHKQPRNIQEIQANIKSLKREINQKIKKHLALATLWETSFNEFEKLFENSQRRSLNSYRGLNGSLLFNIPSSPFKRDKREVSFNGFSERVLMTSLDGADLIVDVLSKMEEKKSGEVKRLTQHFTITWDELESFTALQVIAVIVLAEKGWSTFNQEWSEKTMKCQHLYKKFLAICPPNNTATS